MTISVIAVCKKWALSGAKLILMSAASSGAFAANYYVDNAVATPGNGQSWATAFKSFSAIPWSAINPGDTLYISGGTTSKTYSSPLIVGKSGTSTSRITIRVGQDAGHRGTVIFDRANIQAFKNYITIDGSVNGVPNLHIRNVTATSKDNGWAIEANSSVGLIVRYVETANSNNGINLTYGSTYEVSNSRLSSRGDAVIRGIMSKGEWDTNKIHDNYLESLVSGGGPDTIQVGSGTSIYKNTFKVTRDSSALQGQHPDGLQLAGANIKVYGNEFVDVGDSMIDFDAWAGGRINNIYIYNNLFRIATNVDPYPEFIRIYSTRDPLNSISNLKILNNTFVDTRTTVTGTWGQFISFAFGNGTGAGSGNEMSGNVFRGMRNMSIVKKSGGSQFNMALSNNIYPQAQALDPSGTVGVPSLDANFVPTASDTLARDRGKTMSYFSTDKRGTLRPQGAAWDIGAFEYSGNSSPLAAPTNVQVQ